MFYKKLKQTVILQLFSLKVSINLYYNQCILRQFKQTFSEENCKTN